MLTIFAAAHTGAVLTGVGTLIVGMVGFLTWIAMRKDQKGSAASTLIADALKLYAATADALDDAQEELQTLRDDIAQIRVAVDEITNELTHWRVVAEEARAAYRKEHDKDPFWWRPYRTLPIS